MTLVDTMQREDALVQCSYLDLRPQPEELNYRRQYSQIYFARISQLRPKLIESAKKKWNLHSDPARILHLERGKLCSIIGTIYVDLAFKPNIIEELAHSFNIKNRMAENGDYAGNVPSRIFLEDESARVSCNFSGIETSTIVTGITIALLGIEDEKGIFQVQDICSIPLNFPIMPNTSILRRGVIAILSGNMTNLSEWNFGLLTDYLEGHLDNSSIKIRRVIFAGNTFGKSQYMSIKEDLQSKKFQAEGCKIDLERYSWLDSKISRLAQSLEVDVMSGDDDPTNVSWPQAPILKKLLPLSSRFGSFRTVSNPMIAEYGGIKLIGTSGKNIDDICKSSSCKNRLRLMEMTLNYRHIAPTAPDTLWCFPFSNVDPFVIEDAPHVYFAGNQPSFEFLTIKNGDSRILLLTVPDFSKEPIAALVDLDTLECSPLYISQ